jgi:MFS transporter, NNP family, nitrate/nitrite transporter
VLRASFIAVAVLSAALAAAYESMLPLTIACLTMAVALGLGMGAVFKLVPEWFPERVGAVTGVVGAAGGLGGFFLPTILGTARDAFGSYGPGIGAIAALTATALAGTLVVRGSWIAPAGARA